MIRPGLIQEEKQFDELIHNEFFHGLLIPLSEANMGAMDVNSKLFLDGVVTDEVVLDKVTQNGILRIRVLRAEIDGGLVHCLQTELQPRLTEAKEHIEELFLETDIKEVHIISHSELSFARLLIDTVPHISKTVPQPVGSSSVPFRFANLFQ